MILVCYIVLAYGVYLISLLLIFYAYYVEWSLYCFGV